MENSKIFGPFEDRDALVERLPLALAEDGITVVGIQVLQEKVWTAEIPRGNYVALTMVAMYDLIQTHGVLHARRRDSVRDLEFFDGTCPMTIYSLARPSSIRDMHWRRRCRAFEGEMKRLSFRSH